MSSNDCLTRFFFDLPKKGMLKIFAENTKKGVKNASLFVILCANHFKNCPFGMTSLLLALFARIIANPFSNVFQKKLTLAGLHPLWVNFATFFLLACACVLPALSVNWSAFPAAFWLNCVIAGTLSASGNGFLVKALQQGDLSVLGPINSYKPVVSLIGGIFLLGELPEAGALAGIALIVAGSYFVLDIKQAGVTVKIGRRPEVVYRMAAMVLTAIEALFIKKIIVQSSVPVSFIVWCGFGALFSALLLPVFGIRFTAQLRKSRPSNVRLFVALAATVGLIQATTNYVFARMNVSYALALFQLSAMVSVVLGWKIFHEKNIRRKLGGAALMMAGAILIILTN